MIQIYQMSFQKEKHSGCCELIGVMFFNMYCVLVLRCYDFLNWLGVVPLSFLKNLVKCVGS